MTYDANAAPDLPELLFRGTMDGNLRRERIYAVVAAHLGHYASGVSDEWIDTTTDEAIRIVLRVENRIEELAAEPAPTTYPEGS